MAVNAALRAAAVGTHALVDFYDVPAERLTDSDLLSRCLLDAAKAAGMTPLSAPVLHRFPARGSDGGGPGGVTGFLPLAESHIAFHTYPEWGYLAADIFTCGDCPPDAAVAVLREVLKPGRERVRRVPRGEERESWPPSR